MIFVTTGSTILSSSMEKLIKELDNAKRDSLIEDKIIAQIGNLDYTPISLDEYFDFTNDFDQYVDNADFVITADGAGTIFDLLNKNKKIIVVVNKDAQKYGASAEHFIGKLSENNNLIWCKKSADIVNCINWAKKYPFKKYVKPECTIGETIENRYLEWLKK